MCKPSGLRGLIAAASPGRLSGAMWGKSPGALAGAWFAGICLVAAAFPPGAASQAMAQEAARPSVEFVREGVIARGNWAAGTVAGFRIDGHPVPAQIGPDGQWVLAEYSWRPRQRVTLSWTEGGAMRRLEATAPLRPTPWRAWQITWSGDGSPRAAVSVLAFSPGGSLLAVGSMDGQARVLDTADGRTVWSRLRPGRVIRQVAFSADGRVLYVGEQGPEGRVAAYDVRADGAEALWHFDAAQDLGTSQPADPESPWGWVTYPGAFRLFPQEGAVLAAMTHSWPRGGERIALARIYKLAAGDGTVLWAYPRDGAASQTMTWLAASRGGGRVAVPLQLPVGARAGENNPSRVVVLAGATGLPLFAPVIPPEPPFRTTAFWRGVALSPDGSRLAVSTEDGRGFLFAEEPGGWRRVKALRLVHPIRLGDTTITATNGTLAATAAGPLFVTGPTYIPREYRQGPAPPAAEHPQGNTLFAHDWEGNLRWVWPLDGDLMGIALSRGGEILALAQGREFDPAPGAFQGLAVLRSAGEGSGRERLLYRYAVRGRVVYNGIAVSPGGKWIALAEAPVTEPGRPQQRGAHRIHLLR